MVGFRGHKRGAATALAAMALAAALVAVAMAAPRLGFIHLRRNLSETATSVSAYPDLAVSPDGDWVVAVWTERFTGGARAGHVYLRAASESGGGWGNKVTIFAGDSSARAEDAAVAVTGTTAHVVYSVSEYEGDNLFQTVVLYKTCPLVSGQCSDKEGVFAETDTAYTITHVDIALDEDGDPHVVCGKYKGGTGGDIYYYTRRSSDGNWSASKQWVDDQPTSKDSAPAIAWDSGYAHVVWEDETNQQIRYRKRGDASGTWESVVSLGPPYPPSNPDVAARGGRVFVVWDMCSGADGEGHCAEYQLAYWRSGWATNEYREVGTDNLTGFEVYSSTENVASLPDKDEYLLDLQPSIALNANGWPAVVWHANRGGGGGVESWPAFVWHADGSGSAGNDYAVYYTYAITGSSDVNWVITPTVLNQGQPSMLGSAVVGVGQPSGDEQHLHVAYMGKLSPIAWDVYYDSDENYHSVYLPLICRDY